MQRGKSKGRELNRQTAAGAERRPRRGRSCDGGGDNYAAPSVSLLLFRAWSRKDRDTSFGCQHRVGKFILGYWGVMLMVVLWAAAVGYVWLPIWQRAGVRLAAPGPLFALVLLLPRPSLMPAFGITFLGTSIVMGPLVGLVSNSRKTNVWRGLSCLAISGVSLFISRSQDLPASTPRVLLQLTLLPLGIVLLGAAASAGRRRFAPWAASTLFALGWGVWMLRDYYYRHAA